MLLCINICIKLVAIPPLQQNPGKVEGRNSALRSPHGANSSLYDLITCQAFAFSPPMPGMPSILLSSAAFASWWSFFVIGKDRVLVVLYQSLKSLPLELSAVTCLKLQRQSLQMTSKHETSGDFEHAEWCVLNNLTSKVWHGCAARHIPCHVLPQLARSFLLFCTRQFFLRSHGWVREQGNF